MRIVQLTAGTGSFFCGTCIRDNALVAALRKLGHDALLVPLYLEPVLDEQETAPRGPLFYGGVNVYLQQQSALFRSTPRFIDRLLDSAPVLRAAAARASMTRASDLGALTLSTLRGEDGRQVKELDRLAGWLAQDIRPEAVILPTGLLLGLARRIRQRTGAAILCQLQGEDTYLDALPEKDRAAAWSLIAERSADCDALLPVSRYYADLIAERARFPASSVHVVYPGISLDGFTPASESPDPPVLGFLARMTPAKGLQTLVEAYLLLRKRAAVVGLKLRVGGSRTAGDEPFVQGLAARLESAGLTSDVEFCPNLDRDQKIRFLQSLSVLSVPATYGESFGLYVIEAMAAGVPVVQPRHAAFPEIIEATGGGILCEPDDPAALADAIEELLSNPEAAREMGRRGRMAVEQQFSADVMARTTLAVAERVVARRANDQ